MKRYNVEIKVRALRHQQKENRVTKYKIFKSSYDKSEIDEAIKEQEELLRYEFDSGSYVQYRRWEEDEEEN